MLSPIKEIIEEIKKGRMIILMDDENRENEGDVVMAAEKVTPDAINFMITHCKGLVCLPLSEHLCDYFQLPLMTNQNKSGFGTNFTISIEAKEKITTGISAYDRAKTILTVVNPKSTAADIVSPGHIFPLRAKKGGVLARNGHTEAAVDLAKLAGLKEAGVICEIIKEDGNMARYEDLKIFSKKHNLKITTIHKLQKFLENN